LIDAAVWYTQLDQFEPGQILESRLFDAVRAPAESKQPSVDFLDELASASPAPGGGSAAAHTAAAAAALVAMVCRLTVGKKKYADVEARMWPMIEQAEALRARMNAIVVEDAASFTAFMVATKLPKDTEEQIAARNTAIEKATLEAARVPFETVQHAAEIMQLAVTAAEIGNMNAISDAASAFHLAQAALQSAGLNILVNVKNLQDAAPAAELINGLRGFEKEARNYEKKLAGILTTRGGVEL
jgi:glutamate formiminotransferase/formiminotetrahydrofolate cyclodeaminase